MRWDQPRRMWHLHRWRSFSDVCSFSLGPAPADSGYACTCGACSFADVLCSSAGACHGEFGLCLHQGIRSLLGFCAGARPGGVGLRRVHLWLISAMMIVLLVDIPAVLGRLALGLFLSGHRDAAKEEDVTSTEGRGALSES